MSKKCHYSTLDTCLANKRRYAVLDKFVMDSILRKCVCKEKTSLLRDWLITDSTYLGATNKLLGTILEHATPLRPTRLGEKLTYETLDTLSELALARHFIVRDMPVDFEKPLPGGGDYDLEVTFKDHKFAVEVLSLAYKSIFAFDAEPATTDNNRSARLVQNVIPGSVDLSVDSHKLVHKITDKYKKKFGKALGRGWQGEPWLAFEISKSELDSIEAWTRREYRGTTFLQETRQAIKDKCPDLMGLIFFRLEPFSLEAIDVDTISLPNALMPASKVGKNYD